MHISLLSLPGLGRVESWLRFFIWFNSVLYSEIFLFHFVFCINMHKWIIHRIILIVVYMYHAFPNDNQLKHAFLCLKLYMLLKSFSKQFSKRFTHRSTLTSKTERIYRSWFSSVVVKIVNVTLEWVRYLVTSSRTSLKTLNWTLNPFSFTLIIIMCYHFSSI